MKSSMICTLAMVTTHQAAVEGFATSFLPAARQRASQQYPQHTISPVRMFFGGSSGVFPKLYDGWFKKTGQIEKDMIAGAKSAFRISPDEESSENKGNKGVVKEVLVAAPAGARKPKKGQKVTVHCTGYGKNRDLSQKFWSTKDAGQVPFSYNIGLGNVIKGWDVGVMDMGVGEVAKLTCSPEFGYGAGGFEAWGIMPNSTLCFEIEVLSIE